MRRTNLNTIGLSILIMLSAIGLSAADINKSYWDMFKFAPSSKPKNSVFKGIEASLSGGTTVPLADYAERLEPGLGINAAYAGRGRLAYLGLETGFHVLPGKKSDDHDSDQKKTDYLMSVPICLYIAPYFNLTDSFKITAVIAPGASFTILKYQNEPPSLITESSYTTKTAFMPLIKTGVKASYSISDTLSVAAGCDYNLNIAYSGTSKTVFGFYLLNFISADIKF